MDAIFRYEWPGRLCHCAPVTVLWFELGHDDTGWWFEAEAVGRHRLNRGSAHLCAFAHWLLAPPPAGGYGREFPLVVGAPTRQGLAWRPPAPDAEPVRFESVVSVDVALGRKEPDGPEFLRVTATESAPGTGLSDPHRPVLECATVDRTRLEQAASALLGAARETVAEDQSSDRLETITYVEMTDPGELCPAAPVPAMTLEPAGDDHRLVKEIHGRTGKAYHWGGLTWTDEDWAARLANPRLSHWIIRHGTDPAGLAEIETHPGGDVEIDTFGLAPEFVGRGLGGYALTLVVRQAWEIEPIGAPSVRRVWLHTSTLDHPNALPNYQKRGFRPFGAVTRPRI
jgi:GNAT superfamily N-acetyltransferase